jgi:hypothetical protein
MKTQHFSITKINQLMLFREITVVISGNHTKAINTLCQQNAELKIVKASGTYSYHWVLMGYYLFGCILICIIEFIK